MKLILLLIFSLLSIGVYAQNNLIIEKDSINAPNSVYIKVDRLPEFPGGNDELVHFIHKNAQLPTVNIDSVIAGRVLVEFIVEIDGSLSNIRILRGVGVKYDLECTRLFAIMPKWAPGKIGTHKVRTLMMIPITIS